jgi:hypothetical protein
MKFIEKEDIKMYAPNKKNKLVSHHIKKVKVELSK